MIEIYAFIAALALASVHVFSNQLRILDGVPRHRFLSVAGGMAIAFVLLQLIPGISKGQGAIAEAAQGSVFGLLERHAYLIMLMSIILFYTLEKLARESRSQQQAENKGDKATVGVFWLHMATFGVMNALVGYLLIHRHNTVQALLLFFVAMLVKFIINDHALHNAHKEGYDKLGRWLLAAAILLGWGIGFYFTLPNVGPAMLQAFLAGGVLLNVFKEELPSESKARIAPFSLGALAYAVLLIML